MSFGTLRKDSYFTPGQVLDESTQLDAAIRALGAVQFDHSDVVGDDYLVAWDSFVDSWQGFWAECNAWDGWVFRAEDSTRDELLDLEDTYSDLKAQATSLIGADAAAIDDPTPASARTVDNIASAVSGAGGVLQSAGWQLLAGAGIVVVGLVVLLAVARKGGIPVPL